MVPAFGFVTGLCRVRRGRGARSARLGCTCFVRSAWLGCACFARLCSVCFAQLCSVCFVWLRCARSVFRENKKARTVGARFCESPMG